MSGIALNISKEALDDLMAVVKREAVAEVMAQLQANAEPYLTAKGAAAYLSCKPQRIHELVHQRRIPFHKDGSRLLFKRAELDAYLERREADS